MSNSSQANLPGVEVADHSNRGLQWEKEIEAVNDFYRLQGTADVVKNPSGWVYISESEYQKLLEKQRNGLLPKGMTAVSDDMRKMARVQSDVDFSGGSRGFVFDAKQTRGDALPLKNVKQHQIIRLKRSARCGNVAGLLIKFTDHNRAFFISAAFMDKKFEGWLKQTSIRGRRAKPGAASITIEELELHGVEIKKHKYNDLWDWHVSLAPLLKY